MLVDVRSMQLGTAWVTVRLRSGWRWTVSWAELRGGRLKRCTVYYAGERDARARFDAMAPARDEPF